MILSYQDKAPEISPDAYIAETAQIIGDVVMTRIPDSWTAADVFEG